MRYRVDPDELHKLASGLTDVQAVLDAPSAADGRPPTDLGAPAVAAALAAAETNWSQARHRLVAELDHLVRATETAAANYAVANDAVANGAAR